MLGAVAAKKLATRFGLTGRVDLYHAFVKAMTMALRGGGWLGLLTSNRFLSALIPHFGNALLPRLKEATSKSVQLVLWVFTLVSLRGLSEVNILG